MGLQQPGWRPADVSPTADAPEAPPRAGPPDSGMKLLERARHGTWRVAVVEDSMASAIQPGDWLLVDPTSRGWPRPGAVVVFHEPDTDLLAIKRVAARSGHIAIPEGLLHLEPGEAWLVGDNEGHTLDSRTYGPVPFERFVGRAWFRYGPLRRIGRIGRAAAVTPPR